MNEQQRLKAIMEAEHMSAKDFAEQVGISAATMSNLINGRNNPSLEVMQKILNRFRNVSTNWLILGVGSMYSNAEPSYVSKEPEIGLFDEVTPADSFMNQITEEQPEQEKIKSAQQNSYKRPAQNPGKEKFAAPTARKIEKIIVFYNDGTFEELHG